jgi:hypothetical protein
MNTSDLLMKAASEIQYAINLLLSEQTATMKAASLVNAGAISEADKHRFSELFTGRTEDEMNFAAKAVGLATQQEQFTGWGVEDTAENAFENQDPDNRYARLDSIIMGGSGQY